MSVTTEHLSNYLKELDRYMKRFDRDTLSSRDRKSFFEISNEYYDIFQQLGELPGELLINIAEFNDTIMNPDKKEDKELERKYRDNIVQHANAYLDKTLRSELQIGIFQKDSEIFNLQREKVQMMQELIDLDIKMYGRASELTREILEAEGCEILNGQVSEIPEWERNDSPEETAERASAENLPVRLKFPYMTRDTFMKIKDEIKRMGAEFDPKHKVWYVDQSVGKEAIDNIQNYLAGHDEAIYLKLPPAEPQEFKKMINQLKLDGARYSPDKKQWYITEAVDRKKFERYLQPKDSIYEKLDRYRENAAKRIYDGSISEHQTKKNPERV